MRSSSWRQMASTASCQIRRFATWSTEPRIRLRQPVLSLTRPCNIRRKTTPQPSSCRSARGATTRPVLPSFTASDVRWPSAVVSVKLAASIPSVLYVTLLPSSRGNTSSIGCCHPFRSPQCFNISGLVASVPEVSIWQEFKVRENFKYWTSCEKNWKQGSSANHIEDFLKIKFNEMMATKFFRNSSHVKFIRIIQIISRNFVSKILKLDHRDAETLYFRSK